jgi:hypothetical protein
MGFLTSGIPQGLNQASDTLLRTGMGMMHYNQNKLIQDQAMKIRQEQADREKIAFERQEAAIQEQDARYNAVVPASKYFSKIREFPSYRQSLIEGFKALNLPYEETPDGDVIGKYGHGMEVMKWIYASGERAEKQAKGVFGDLQNKKMTLLEQLPTVKKPEEAKAIQDQIAQISEQQAQVIGSTWDVQKKMLEEQGKPPKAPTQVIVGDEIKYRDENGNFVEGLGGPRYKPDKGRDPEVKADKEIDKADKRIQGVINGYDAQIDIFEKKLAAAEKAEDSKAIKRWSDSIDNFQKEKSKAINTQNQLRNGTLPPDKIMWGGNKVQTTTTYKTADDVKAAFKSGKIKEAEAVKILKDKFGMT